MTRLSLALLLALAGLARAGESDLEKMLQKVLGQRLWYGVYMKDLASGKADQKSGYALVEDKADKIGDRDAVACEVKMRLKITLLGQQQDMRMSERRVYLRTGEFHSASSRIWGGATDMEVSAEVKDGKLLVTSRTGGLVAHKDLPVPKESLADFLVAERLVKPDAKVGDQVTNSLFEPLMLGEVHSVLTLVERRTITYNGVPTPVYVLKSTMPALGVSSNMFVDGEGTVLEFSVSDMFVLRLEPEQEAKNIQYSSDIVRVGCVKLDPPPKGVAQLRRLRLQVWGLPDDYPVIDDARQTWTKQADGSSIVDVKVPPIDPAKAAKLPVDPAQFAAELAPTLYVQSDDPQIKAQAAQIVGDERDAYAAARKIGDWVYRNLKKVGTPALSNAVETLQSKQGDCTEHTVLFVALARAAGIPARECAGVTAVERGEGLYYHAWPEVWVGQWVAMDPTLDEHLDDATHLKLAQGGIEQLFRIVGLFGRLKAKVLEAAQ